MKPSQWITLTFTVTVLLGLPAEAELRGRKADTVLSLAPTPGACLVKRFENCAGQTLTGVRLLSNDRTTIFPQVDLVQGVQGSLSSGLVLRRAVNVRSEGSHGVTATFTPLVVRDASPIYVVIELPAEGARASAKGVGVGLGAWYLTGGPDTYIAPTVDDALQTVDVSLAVELVSEEVSKAVPTDATAEFIRVESPHNAATTIRFGLQAHGRVRLAIYDIAGRRVRVLVDENRSAGVHEVVWDGLNDSSMEVSAGVYFAKMTAGGRDVVQKVVRTR